jgi:hypothetical protein
MDPFTERFRMIVARYLDGEQSLDTAVSDFAALWKEWHKARLGALRADTASLPETPPPGIDVLHAGDELRPGMTDEEFPRLLEFMDRVSAKMSEGEHGAA